MKKNCSTPSAFFIPRVLIGLLLTTLSVVLALFAFGVTPLDDSSSQTGKPNWFHRLASTFGVQVNTNESAARRGGGGPVSKSSKNQVQRAVQPQSPVAYAGPRNDLRPVSPVRTLPLRNMPAIPPRLAPAPFEREPIRPQPPTDLTGADRAAQTFQGPVGSAPSPGGVSFEGVGAGIPGFIPIFVPPDTNGRIGATQYVQWNNASFAIWDKSG